MSDQKIISPTELTEGSGKVTINNTVAQGTLVNDGNNDRILLGFQKDGFGTGVDYGLKISKDGEDVKTASNDNLIFNSAQNVFKIVGAGTMTVNKAGGSETGSDSIQHGLKLCSCYYRVYI
jgi:hypothetical protein